MSMSFISRKTPFVWLSSTRKFVLSALFTSVEENHDQDNREEQEVEFDEEALTPIGPSADCYINCEDVKPLQHGICIGDTAVEEICRPLQ